MIHIGLKIKQLAEQKNISSTKLSEILGYKSRKASYDLFEKEDVNTEILQKLSDYCEIPVTYFFEDTEKVTIPSIEKVNKQSVSFDAYEELKATLEKANHYILSLEQDKEYFKDLVKQQFQLLNARLDSLGKKLSGVENVEGEKELFKVAA